MTKRSIDALAIGTCYVDTNLSDYPFGNEGIPAEVELVGENYEVVPGGSAVNFCRLLGDLGLKSAFIGMRGSDPNGDSLEHLLEQHGVIPALVEQPDLLTNISFNMTSPDGKHIMLVAGTANAALNPEGALPKLQEMLPMSDMLYMGGCFKLKAFAEAFEDIAALAEQNATKLVVDHGRVPEGASDEMVAAVKRLVLRAQYYLPSREEFCKTWNVETIENGLQVLAEQAPELTVVVKDGSNGAFYFADGDMQHVESEKVEKVVNATGAGDSFNAGVMAGLASDLPLPRAIAYGNKVAAAKISGQESPVL